VRGVKNIGETAEKNFVLVLGFMLENTEHFEVEHNFIDAIMVVKPSHRAPADMQS
jgi:hypothetical protein